MAQLLQRHLQRPLRSPDIGDIGEVHRQQKARTQALQNGQATVLPSAPHIEHRELELL
jgi:hypothetical protein